MRELFQETCDYFLLMVLFRDGCFPSVFGRRDLGQ